jgi:hypothetical protein
MKIWLESSFAKEGKNDKTRFCVVVLNLGKFAKMLITCGIKMSAAAITTV